MKNSRKTARKAVKTATASTQTPKFPPIRCPKCKSDFKNRRAFSNHLKQAHNLPKRPIGRPKNADALKEVPALYVWEQED